LLHFQLQTELSHFFLIFQPFLYVEHPNLRKYQITNKATPTQNNVQHNCSASSGLSVWFSFVSSGGLFGFFAAGADAVVDAVVDVVFAIGTLTGFSNTLIIRVMTHNDVIDSTLSTTGSE